MTKWIAAAALAVILSVAGLVAAPAAVGAPIAMQEAHGLKATEVSARHRDRQGRVYVYHPYYPYYLGHPYYYSPGPFLLPWFDRGDRW